jgi:hypothetical protein
VFKSFVTLALFALVTPCFGAEAESTNHWAYEPLHRPAIPNIRIRSWARTPIDRFVAAKLESNGWSPAVEADRRTLLRRVYFDLVGLPPTPEATRAFLSDTSPNAYERVVDELLASPRYGERWARHWMDAIHFAETHGHDQDRIRTNAWPYRDYLIQSLNSDKPYARFMQEQVAGDVLFPEDPLATIALGFLAAGPWDESTLRDIREDTVDRQMGRYLDRDDVVTTVMQTFTSTTVHCARCHNHKFDPVPQSDYYALQAVFAGVDRADRVYDQDPAVHRKRAALRRERERANHDTAWLLSTDINHEVMRFVQQHLASEQSWKIVAAETFVSMGGATLARQPDGSFLAMDHRPEKDTCTITAKRESATVTAVRLEVMADKALPQNGPGRADNGNLHLSEFELLLFEAAAPVPRRIPFSSASASFNQAGWTIDHAIDGKEKTAWGIHPNVGQSHHAVFHLERPLDIPDGAKLVFVLKQLHGGSHLVGRFRLSTTETAEPGAVLPPALDSIARRPSTERSEKERLALAKFVVGRRIETALARLSKPSLVYAAAADFEPDGGHKPAGKPRPVHILRRGDIHRPIQAAVPGALSCVEPLEARFTLPDTNDEGARRAALAKWLSDPANALTWRSIVNRVWHHHFTRGLVETPNDFGRMGGKPSHPELLDWLAVWFRDEARGSLKSLHRMIVTSATFRQVAYPVEEQISRPLDSPGGEESGTRGDRPSKVDAGNHLLSRMNRARLDADQVRDAILQIAGALDLRMGGPSDRQFDLQPGHHVTPKVDYAKFDVNAPEARRRSVYRFLFRTLPDPFMDALDCPAGDQLTPVRNASVTVQQALAMWNDAFVANYAERMAERLENHSKQLDEQITFGCKLVWNREPTRDESSHLRTYAQRHGLANLCRVLLNSNEFMFVN